MCAVGPPCTRPISRVKLNCVDFFFKNKKWHNWKVCFDELGWPDFRRSLAFSRLPVIHKPMGRSETPLKKEFIYEFKFKLRLWLSKPAVSAHAPAHVSDCNHSLAPPPIAFWNIHFFAYLNSVFYHLSVRGWWMVGPEVLMGRKCCHSDVIVMWPHVRPPTD